MLASPNQLLASTPPHSQEAERAVLGSLLIDQGALDEVRPLLTPTSFYAVAHGQLYSAILDLHAKGRPVDVVSLNDYLSAKGVLEQCGGTIALAELTESVPSSANAAYYADQVRGLHLKRRVILACAQAQRLAYKSPSLSGAEVAREAEQIVLAATAAAEEGRPDPLEMAEIAPQVLGAYVDPTAAGMSTGIAQLDDLTLIFPSQFLLIAARTSHGKTSLLLTVLRHVAKEYGHVCLFSLEEPATRIGQRVAIAEARVDNSLVRRKNLGHDDTQRYFDALDRMSRGGMRIMVNDWSRTIEEICAVSRRMVAKRGVVLIGVDYAQLVGTEERFNTERDRIDHVSKSLQKLAHDTSCPVIACAQLNRAVEARKDRKMLLSDLRSCGSLEEDSDQAWLVERPCRYDDKIDDSQANVVVGKCRGGTCGTAKVTFRPRQEEFVSWEGEKPWL